MVTERSSTISLTRPETTISSACADPKRSASVPPGARRTLGPSGRARNYGARAEARLGRIVEAPHDEEAETGKVGSHRGHELREERGIRFMATSAAVARGVGAGVGGAPAFLLLRETTNGRIPTLDWLGLGRISAVKTALDFKKYHISITLKSRASFWGD